MKQDLKFKHRRDGKGFYLQEGDLHFISWSFGIGWSGDKPGWLVMIGREQQAYPSFPDSYYHLLAETQANSNSELLDKCIEYLSRYPTKNVFARLDESMRSFVERYNAEARRASRKTVLIQQPPHVQNDGSLGYHVNVLLHRLQRGNETFGVEETFHIRSELLAIPRDKLNSIRDVDFPALGAVCYGLVGLETYSAIPQRPKSRQDSLTWDPYHRRGSKR